MRNIVFLFVLLFVGCDRHTEQSEKAWVWRPGYLRMENYATGDVYKAYSVGGDKWVVIKGTETYFSQYLVGGWEQQKVETVK